MSASQLFYRTGDMRASRGDEIGFFVQVPAGGEGVSLSFYSGGVSLDLLRIDAESAVALGTALCEAAKLVGTVSVKP